MLNNYRLTYIDAENNDIPEKICFEDGHKMFKDGKGDYHLVTGYIVDKVVYITDNKKKSSSGFKAIELLMILVNKHGMETVVPIKYAVMRKANGLGICNE